MSTGFLFWVMKTLKIDSGDGDYIASVINAMELCIWEWLKWQFYVMYFTPCPKNCQKKKKKVKLS